MTTHRNSAGARWMQLADRYASIAAFAVVILLAFVAPNTNGTVSLLAWIVGLALLTLPVTRLVMRITRWLG